MKRLDAKEIFCEAIGKKTAAERSAYLDEACKDDEKLREEVEALLKAHYEADDKFLKSPPGINATLNAGPLSEGPGIKIGHYKLLQLIGEGGFGVVYMAEQEEPIRRKVALKIIKLGMDTKQVIARFEAERQALAMMDHSNIAKVFDAGATDTGRPYFVMELVKGIPITEYCDKNNLDTRQRLELFIDVCKAVQHAHQKGIIHRDIKPSNVMITMRDGKPMPKIIDFGIAKATQHRLTEKTLFTEFRQFIGTPEYMSPEQAEMSVLDIDTRSDIYSLGVLLYELMTGTTPFAREQLLSVPYDQMRKVISETDPPKPSTRLSTLGDTLADTAKHRNAQPAQLCKIVRGDLDWIVMKSLEKDRTRRYETANEFAADVGRHLSDEPVLAGPPSTIYRVRKFTRRHRTGVFAGISLVASLVIGFSLAITGFVQASNQRDIAQTHRQRAETNFVMARDAVEEMTRLAEEQLADVPQTEQVRRELLQKAQVFYASFAEKNRNDPAVSAEIALAYRRLGRIHTDLGNFSQAREAFWQAIELLERLTVEFPDEPEYRAELAGCWFNHTNMLPYLGQRPQMIIGYRKMLSLFEDLVADFPEVPGYLQALAYAHAQFGSCLSNEEGETHLRESLVILEKLNADFPDTPKNPNILCFCHYRLGAHLLRIGQLEEAEHHLLQVMWLREKHLAEKPDSESTRGNLARIKSFFCAVLKEQGKFKEAEKEYRECIAIRKKLIEEFPSRFGHRERLGNLLIGLYRVLRQRGRTQEAEDTLREAVFHWEKLAGNYPEASNCRNSFGDSLVWLGNMLSETDRLEEAMENYQDAVTVYEELVADFPNKPTYQNKLANIYIRLGNILRDTYRLEEAEEAYQKGLLVCGKAIEMDPNNPHYWHTRETIYIEMEEGDKVVAEYTKAIELDPDNLFYWHRRGNIYLQLGQWTDMVSDFNKVIELDPNNWWGYHERGYAYMQLGQWDKVVADYTEAISLKPDDRSNYNRRGNAYATTQQWSRAISDYSKLIELDPNNASTLYRQALVHLGMGDTEGYRKRCVAMLECFSQTENFATAHWVAWTCVLASDAVEDFNRVIELAKLAVEEGGGTDQNRNALGAVLYRAGRFDEAVQELSELETEWEQGREFPTLISPAYTWFFLAMTHHQLGNADQSQRYFELAVEQAREEMAGDASWNRRLTLQLLRAEAAQLLGIP